MSLETWERTCAAWLLCLLSAAPAASAEIVGRSRHCLAAPYHDAETPAERRILNLIEAVRFDLTGIAPLLAVFEAAHLDICIDGSLIVEKAYYEPKTNRIVLSDDLESGLARAILVHELRHVEQFRRDICPSDTLAMKEYARATLALEADATTVAILVAWQQREAGDEQPWQALASWHSTDDIAARFAAVMVENGNVASAAAAAFDQWYASEVRQERYYIASCSQYLDQQDNLNAVPSYRDLSDDYLQRLCVLPDGKRYPCIDTPNRNR